MFWGVLEPGEQFVIGLPSTGLISSYLETGHMGKVEGIWCARLWEALSSSHIGFTGMGRSTLVLFTCILFWGIYASCLSDVGLVPCPDGHRLTSIVGPLGRWEVRSLVRFMVWLGRFTAALRSGLMAGESLRGIGSNRDQARAGMFTCDYQNGCPRVSRIGWLASDAGQRNSSFA